MANEDIPEIELIIKVRTCVYNWANMWLVPVFRRWGVRWQI